MLSIFNYLYYYACWFNGANQWENIKGKPIIEDICKAVSFYVKITEYTLFFPFIEVCASTQVEIDCGCVV
jgi:hypothetical protein